MRDVDGVLAQRGVWKKLTGRQVGDECAQLYQALPVSDQAQMREFYLSKLEDVDQALRHKFQKLYQYY